MTDVASPQVQETQPKVVKTKKPKAVTTDTELKQVETEVKQAEEKIAEAVQDLKKAEEHVAAATKKSTKKKSDGPKKKSLSSAENITEIFNTVVDYIAADKKVPREGVLATMQILLAGKLPEKCLKMLKPVKVPKTKKEPKLEGSPAGKKNAFIIYSNEQNAKRKAAGLKNLPKKELGAIWGALSADEQAPYKKLQEDDRVRWETERVAFNASHGPDQQIPKDRKKSKAKNEEVVEPVESSSEDDE